MMKSEPKPFDPREERARLIAFYLPQFHPIPENDDWWGKGFTEWANVAKARPNFKGHHQPHLPADLGFYDLRLPEILAAQAGLVRRYGLEGLCFYYYNFGGHRLLETPLDRWIEGGHRGLPFCLCWANESWTQHWDGRTGTTLIAQHYSAESLQQIIRDLCRYLRHPDYIRVAGKPLLLVYRIGELPDPATLAPLWRAACRDEGVGEISLAFVETFDQAVFLARPADIGFDASVEFPPHGTSIPTPPPGRLLNPAFDGVVSDYREIARHYATKPLPGFRRFRCAMPRWDNTPRQQDRPYVFANASPGAFQAWLETLVEQALDQGSGDEKIVFVNAWNEWAEGAHIEPDARFGHGFLEAVRNALDRVYLPGRREP
ncbi:MAG: hypothetical protein C3F14_09970 [Deltaproteobacteria bacterium]|nr:MAG: hypothetical protein C3F14_09970 [Deltaproteobacteria bacterium]